MSVTNPSPRQFDVGSTDATTARDLAQPQSLESRIHHLNMDYLCLIQTIAAVCPEDAMIRFGLSRGEVDEYARLTMDQIRAIANPSVLQIAPRRRLRPMSGPSLRMFIAETIFST